MEMGRRAEWSLSWLSLLLLCISCFVMVLMNPTESASTEAPTTTTIDETYVYINNDAYDCDSGTCDDYSQESVSELVEGTASSFAHLLTFEQRPIMYTQASTVATYKLEFVGSTNDDIDNVTEYIAALDVDSLSDDQSTTISPTSGAVNVSAVDSDPTDAGTDISGNYGTELLTVTLDDASTNDYEIFLATLESCATEVTCSVVNPRELYLVVKNEVSTENSFADGGSSGGGSGDDGLGTGALVGIIVGSICLVAIVAVGICFYCRKQRGAGRGGTSKANEQGGIGLLEQKPGTDDKGDDYQPPAGIGVERSDDIDGPETNDTKVY